MENQLIEVQIMEAKAQRVPYNYNVRQTLYHCRKCKVWYEKNEKKPSSFNSKWFAWHYRYAKKHYDKLQIPQVDTEPGGTGTVRPGEI